MYKKNKMYDSEDKLQVNISSVNMPKRPMTANPVISYINYKDLTKLHLIKFPMLLSATICQHIKKAGVRSQTNERNADKYILVTWQSMLHTNIVSLG